MCIITELILIITLAPLTDSSPYTLDEFEGHLPGLYFEYMAQVHTNLDHWSMFIAIDLDRIRPDYTHEEQITDMLKECPDIPLTCDLLLARSRHLQRKSERINLLFENFHDLLLNSEKFNPNNLPDLFVPSLASSPVIDRETQVQDLREEVTSKYFHAIKKARTPGAPIVDYNKAAKSWLVALDDLLDTYQVIFEHTWELIREAIEGRASPYLLTPQGLVNMINYINKRHSTASFPKTTTPETVRKLIKAEVEKRGSTLGIILHFPLYSVNHYFLYRMYSTPVPIGNYQSNYITTSSEYILIRHGDYNHTFLNYEYIQECTKLNNLWYCESPTIFLTDSCEIHLLIDPTHLDVNNCNLQVRTQNTTEWIYLQESDEWIYSAPRNDTLNIQCNNDFRVNETIGRLGMLKLTQGCVATNHHYVLQPRHKESKIGYIYTLTDPLNLTRHHEVPLNQIQTTEDNTRISHMETLIYILYYAWPISVILSLIFTGLVVHRIYKRRAPPQPSRKSTRPEIIHLKNQEIQTLYTCLYQKNKPQDTEYSIPPSPKPILIHPPLGYEGSLTTPRSPTSVRFNLDADRIKEKNSPDKEDADTPEDIYVPMLPCKPTKPNEDTLYMNIDATGTD